MRAAHWSWILAAMLATVASAPPARGRDAERRLVGRVPPLGNADWFGVTDDRCDGVAPGGHPISTRTGKRARCLGRRAGDLTAMPTRALTPAASRSRVAAPTP
jgi:hypothetical protein